MAADNKYMAQRQLSETEHEVLESTIQQLYALGLRLEVCLHLVDEEADSHREVVDSAITCLGDLIDRLRERIEALEC